MKAFVQLAPLAIALIVFGAVVAFTLPRNATIGAWLLAAFIVGHGLVHVMFAAPPPATGGTPGAEFAFDVNRSWMVASGVLDVGIVKTLVVALVAVTVVGYAMAGAATAGVVVPTAWWSALVLIATAASGVLMIVGLMPSLVLGIAIDVVLAWLVLSRSWSPGAA